MPLPQQNINSHHVDHTQVSPPKSVYLIGSGGSGKTSFLNCLKGELPEKRYHKTESVMEYIVGNYILYDTPGTYVYDSESYFGNIALLFMPKGNVSWVTRRYYDGWKKQNPSSKIIAVISHSDIAVNNAFPILDNELPVDGILVCSSVVGIDSQSLFELFDML